MDALALTEQPRWWRRQLPQSSDARSRSCLAVTASRTRLERRMLLCRWYSSLPIGVRATQWQCTCMHTCTSASGSTRQRAQPLVAARRRRGRVAGAAASTPSWCAGASVCGCCHDTVSAAGSAARADQVRTSHAKVGSRQARLLASQWLARLRPGATVNVRRP